MGEWAAYKPVLTALLLPPVPWLVLVLLGARWLPSRRSWGWAAVSLGVAGLWMSGCQQTALWLQAGPLRPPSALSVDGQARLAAPGRVQAGRAPDVVRKARSPVAASIIVLGGGVERLAPEYGVSALSVSTERRLSYGIWLSRLTGLPLGFSGGIGWAQQGGRVGASEAETAARIAMRDHGVRLRWVEGASSDTRENAARTMALLAAEGVREVVLVTDAVHMPRAVRAFQEAARHQASRDPAVGLITVTPAPVAHWARAERPVLDWLPSTDGLVNVRAVLREWLGWLAGA